MSVNGELQKVSEWQGLRGFSNLFNKEHGAWWETPRWWINALLWTGMLCGLTAIMLFMPNQEVFEATQAEINQAGGLVAFILSVGLNVFFEFGIPIMAIGTVIQSQDLIISEKQNGVIEWLLSKPVTRRSYLLAKLFANILPVLSLFIGLPSIVVYGLLSLRMGEAFSLAAFLPAVGMMVLNTLFYLTLTLMLGTIFNNRGPVLGIAFASILGGGLLASFINPLFYVTPWLLPKAAWLTATGQLVPVEMEIAALVSTTVWCLVFVWVALVKFEKMEL